MEIHRLLRVGVLGPSGTPHAAEQNPRMLCYLGNLYGIFTYIWLMFMVNVGKYTIWAIYEINP